MTSNSVSVVYAETPDIDIQITETMTVTETTDLTSLEIIDIQITETMTVTETTDLTSLEIIDIQITETMTVTESSSVSSLEPIYLSVIETMTVTESSSVSSLEPIDLSVIETMTVTESSSVSSLEPIVIEITEKMGLSDSTGTSAPSEAAMETIDPDFFATVVEVEDDAAAVKLPGILSPFIDTVEAGTSSPKIITLLTTEGATVKILANQSTQISNPFNSAEVQEIEKDWKIIVSANQSPSIGADVARELLATANEITVIPDKPLASHKRCTVVEETADNKTSLACDDGEQIIIDQAGLDAGSNAVILVHPEKPAKVISTAKSLLSRMDRFKASMQGQENANLAAFDKIKTDVDKGFYSSKERAISKAPAEVKALMTKLSDINQRIVDMATAFTGGDPNVTVSASSMTTLANMLKELAANPDFSLDLMIDGSEDDVPLEKKQELKALIREASGDHFSNLKTGILEVVSSLEAGDLEDALTKLETLTANDEAWEKNVVMPIMQDFYGDMKAFYDAEYAKEAENLAENVAAEIVIIKELLAGDTSWIDSETKSQIESALTGLEEAQATNDSETMFNALMTMVELMHSLPTEQEVFEEGYEGMEGMGEEASVSDILDALNEEITRAASMLSEFADSIDAKDSQNILDLISSLKQLDSTNDRDTIHNGLMNLVNALNAAFPYEEGHEQGSGTTAALTSVSVECPPMFVVGGKLGCSFKTEGMYDNHEWTGTFSTDGSQIKSSETLFVASYQQTGTVSLEVSVCNSAGCVKGNHTIEIVEPKEGEVGGHEGGSQEQPSSGGHDGGSQEQPSSGDHEEGSQGTTESSLTINIECAPTFSVGQNVECSFKSDGMVESIDWTATFSADGSQMKSGEPFFKASYAQPGTVSLSLTACGNSICADDTYSIAIVEPQPSNEGDDSGEAQVEGDDSGEAQVEGDHSGEAQVEGDDSG